MCAPRRTAQRFRIAPTLMADHDPKGQRTGLENLPPRAGRIDNLLGGVELDLVLETGDRPVSIDDQCSGQQGAIDDAFGAENNPEACLRGGRCNGGPGALKERRVGGRHRLPHSSVAGNEAFREANQAGTLDGRLSDGLFGRGDRLLGSRREWDVGECNSKRVHLKIRIVSLTPGTELAVRQLG